MATCRLFAKSRTFLDRNCAQGTVAFAGSCQSATSPHRFRTRIRAVQWSPHRADNAAEALYMRVGIGNRRSQITILPALSAGWYRAFR